MTTPQPQVTDELLSAYLDGAVTDQERLLVEQAIAADAGVAWRLEGLRQTISLVRALPQVALPRSFSLEAILAAEQAGQSAPVASPPPRPTQRPAPRRTAQAARRPSWWERWGAFWNSGSLPLRNAAAAAFALFLVVLIGAQTLAPQTPILTDALPASPAAPAVAPAAALPAGDSGAAPEVAVQADVQAEAPAGEAALPVVEPAQAKTADFAPLEADEAAAQAAATGAQEGTGAVPAPQATPASAVAFTAPVAEDAGVSVSAVSEAAAPLEPFSASPGGEATTDLDRAMVESGPPGAVPSGPEAAARPGLGGGGGAPGMGGAGGGGGEMAAGDSPLAVVAAAAGEVVEGEALRAEQATVTPAVDPVAGLAATPTTEPTVAPTTAPTPTPAQVALAGPTPVEVSASAAPAQVAEPLPGGRSLNWLMPAAIALGGASLLLFGLWLISRARSGAR